MAEAAEISRQLTAAVARLRSIGVAMRVRARKLAEELPTATEPAGAEALARRVLEASALAERLAKRAKRSAEEALAGVVLAPAPAPAPAPDAVPDPDSDPDLLTVFQPFVARECRVAVERSTDPRFSGPARPLIRCVSPSRLLRPSALAMPDANVNVNVNAEVVTLSSDSEPEVREKRDRRKGKSELWNSFTIKRETKRRDACEKVNEKRTRKRKIGNKQQSDDERGSRKTTKRQLICIKSDTDVSVKSDDETSQTATSKLNATQKNSIEGSIIINIEDEDSRSSSASSKLITTEKNGKEKLESGDETDRILKTDVNENRDDVKEEIMKNRAFVSKKSDDETRFVSNEDEESVAINNHDETSRASNGDGTATKKNGKKKSKVVDKTGQISKKGENKNGDHKENESEKSEDNMSRSSSKDRVVTKRKTREKNKSVTIKSDDEAKNNKKKKSKSVCIQSEKETSSNENESNGKKNKKEKRNLDDDSNKGKNDETSETSSKSVASKSNRKGKPKSVHIQSDDETDSVTNEDENNVKNSGKEQHNLDDETSESASSKSIAAKKNGKEKNISISEYKTDSILNRDESIVEIEGDKLTSNKTSLNSHKKKIHNCKSDSSKEGTEDTTHHSMKDKETCKEKLILSSESEGPSPCKVASRNRKTIKRDSNVKNKFTPEEIKSFVLEPEARRLVNLHMERNSAVVPIVPYPRDEVAFEKYLTENRVCLYQIPLDSETNEAIKRNFLKSSDSDVSERETSDVDESRLLNIGNKAASKRKTQKTAKRRTKLNSSERSDDDLAVKEDDTGSDSNKPDDDIANDMPRIKSSKPTNLFASDLLEDSSSDLDDSNSKMNGRAKNGEDSGDSKNNKKNRNKDESEKDSNKKSSKSKNTIDSTGEEDNDEDNNSSHSKAKDDSLGGTDSNDSEVFKPSKRKRKKNKSSGESSGEQSSSDKKGGKKRKRIKQLSGDDSDRSGEGEGGSSSESEGGTKKHGRKNIRRVKKSKNLDEATRTAARIERERIQRITDRQKLYNESMFDESGRPDEVKKLEKVDLDFDPDTKKPIISVDRGIVEKLKPHQANGIKFMWDACFESVKQIENGKGSGCILAHCMGLGKTLQVVALVHTLLTHQKLTNVERVLVVCPLSTVLNWVNEFRMWLKHAKCKDDIEIYEISKYKQNYERSNQLKEWIECGGVCVLGYDMFRNLSADNNKKFRKAQLGVFQRALVDPGPDLVVCDEGHLLKNEKTSLSQSMNRVKSLRRIVLTGTPLQNNLKEYYCMVQFVKPNLLGKYNEYLNRFVNPITNGQYTDSTEHDIRVMKRRSHVLHKMLDGAVQRRDYAVLAPFLPPKHEYVLFITLTDIQIKLYSHYMENYSRRPQPDRKNTGFLFADFQSLQRVWTHPLVLKANSERYEIMQQKKREKEEEDSEGSLVDFIDDDETTTPDETSSDNDSLDSDDSNQQSKKKKTKKPKKSSKRVTRAARAADSDEPIEIKCEDPPPDVKIDNPTEWWMSLCSEEELDDVKHSNKLILLLEILKMCEAIGDKLLVFSQSLYSLDLIEQFLWKIDEATQKGESNERLAGHLGSWSPGIDYFRLDGSSSCENRAIWCKNFNKEDNPRARLFLISTRAGGLGINLVAANRVVIFDMSWNPSHDVQSIFRVYRFGQKKPCYVYRFLALGTMEEKIYERQVTKQAISKRVIDEQQIDRHYAESDLAELYTFCPVPEGAREVPKLPKDRLFADLFKAYDATIYKYHEHDSLLENKEEETLTEEERKAAWEDYENEKTRPPVSFGNQFLAGYQQQQQHHMALSALLQQDYPGLSEQQVTGMVPALLQQLYQNGDPMLMQKMNSMMAAQNSTMSGFKYPQVNSNLIMNDASGTSGGTNFTSSWQQQQQIQLQRLQQQQAMQANLKYYAGGLGSRDTMDMAALQQRQRAMMMTTAPSLLPTRGRPPKNPRVPIMPAPIPTDTGEIFEIDSE